MDLPALDPGQDPRLAREQDRRRLLRAVLASAAFVALLWWMHLARHLWGQDLDALALRPGEPWGLIGILTAPLLHASVAHLVSNTLPLLLLGSLALATLPRATPRALGLIWLLAGAGTWLIGRPSLHLGASGLSHGLMVFLFLAGLIRRDRPAIATALITFFLYGGMLLTVLPREPGVSWEYHLSGAVGGLVAALLWARLDPPPPRKRYSWEDEDDARAEDPRDHEFEPPAPQDVPVLWQRAEPGPTRGVVLPFRRPDADTPGPARSPAERPDQ
ncbi:MAG: hypothetical protein KatS3mg126_0723 [Lysobacteraceae bacterium]|nr:MAG: hypothetical protein KatS3mg126_0723 [Xanthomonadaceae bacterium]